MQTSTKTWLCGICGRETAQSSFKRHVNAHERNGIETAAVNDEWRAFLDATGWPRRAANSQASADE